MTPEHAKATSLNTDYPIDQIIFQVSGQLTVPNGTSDSSPYPISIPHGLTYAPLPILLWSNTSGFEITNEGMDAELYSNIFTTFQGQEYEIYSDSTNLYIYRYNNSGSSKTVYYRIFCFAPSNANIDSVAADTVNDGSSFVINTDINYMKLLNNGILTTVSNVYNHNLGYVPRVQSWSEASGLISRFIQGQLISTDTSGSGGQTSGLHVNENSVVWLNPNTYDAIHYRIYLDE